MSSSNTGHWVIRWPLREGKGKVENPSAALKSRRVGRACTIRSPGRPQQERLRDRQPERLRGLEVDDQLELGGLFDGEVGGLCAFEDLVDVGCRASKHLGIARRVRDKASGLHELFVRIQ